MSDPMPASVIPPGQTPPTRHQLAGRARLSAGLGIATAEGVAGYLHPELAEALAIADVAIPVLLVLILFAVVVGGSQETCDRVFRLLRWITNRPEPAAPDSRS
jgi:hypothetical protein